MMKIREKNEFDKISWIYKTLLDQVVILEDDQKYSYFTRRSVLLIVRLVYFMRKCIKFKTLDYLC